MVIVKAAAGNGRGIFACGGRRIRRIPVRAVGLMAEREGFEPSIEFPLYTLSKRAPSTTRPSLHSGNREAFSRIACPLAVPAAAAYNSGSDPAIDFAARPACRCRVRHGLRKTQGHRHSRLLLYRQPGSRSVSVVDLSRFRSRTHIALDAAPPTWSPLPPNPHARMCWRARMPPSMRSTP